MKDADELQQLARLVEVNRSRMERLSEQITRLEEASSEHSQVLKALTALESGEEDGTMIPLGAGVQLVVEQPEDSGVVIDIGSNIQLERPLTEAIPMVEKRLGDIESLLAVLNEQFDSTEESVAEVVEQFNSLLGQLQAEASSEESPQEESEPEVKTTSTPRRRRSLGGDLTLDD